MKRVAAAFLLLLFARPLAAQQTQQLDLDFRPWAAGTLAYVWNANAAGSRAWGVSLGGGIDALDRTLVPDTESPDFSTFYQLIHAGALHRWRAGTAWDLDLGMRIGVGDVRECNSGDCWPGGYIGVYFAPMWGGRVFKVGPRFMVAGSRYREHRDFIIYTEVLNGRLSLRW